MSALIVGDLPSGRPPAKYERLDRKDVRIFPGQMEVLTRISKRLNKRRQGAGERITENTLIRLAIDLLCEYAHHLEGIDEDQLRESLKLPERKLPLDWREDCDQ